MFNLGVALDAGEGVPTPDHPAAADWYRRAADAGHESAAYNLCAMYTSGRGRALNIMLASSSSKMTQAGRQVLDPHFMS
jgi:TPR repeat protein